jgi:amino acid transporter
VRREHINMAMPHRAFLVWALDGLMPRRLSKRERGNACPITAIAITAVIAAGCGVWIAYSSSFLQYLGVASLFSFPTIMLVGVTAILIPRLRPDLYRAQRPTGGRGGGRSSPSAGVSSIFVGAGAIFLALYFAPSLGITHRVLTGLAPLLVLVAALIWWFAARDIQRRRGVDISLPFKVIPPD